jgi:hypothetical protein
LAFDYDTNSSPELIQVFHAAAKSLAYEQHFEDKGTGWAIKDDHIPFQQKLRIPVIDLIDMAEARATHSWWHTKDDDMSKVSAESLTITGQLILDALPRIEQHTGLFR